MNAYWELPEIAANHRISFITGLQVSASHNGHFFRLLAYDCNPEKIPLQNLLKDNLSVWEEFGGQVIKILPDDHPELSVNKYHEYQKNPKHGGFK